MYHEASYVFFSYIGRPPILRPWVIEVLFTHVAHKIVSRHLLEAVDPLAGDGDMASHIYNAVPVTEMFGHGIAMYRSTADSPVGVGPSTRLAKVTGVIPLASTSVSHSAIQRGGTRSVDSVAVEGHG